jgi:hypothetical protein
VTSKKTRWTAAITSGGRKSACGALLLWVSLCRPAGALVSTNVPLDHWSYAAVEKLADYGLIEGSMLGLKPFSRVEMARHIAAALYTLEGMPDAPAILQAILERLTDEFREELVLLGVLDGSYGDSSLKPVENPYVAYLYGKDKPDLENVRGDEFQQGSNVRAGFASRMKFFDTAAFYLHPEYAYASPRDDVDLIEVYGKVMVGPFEVEAGKDSLWWGPGYHGSLLMSNNAQPFTMIKLSTAALAASWFLRAAGPFKAEWFLAGWEDQDFRRQTDGPALNLKPLPLVELGASRVIMLGGEGAPSVSCYDYFESLVTGGEEETQSNQLAGVDGALLLPLPNGMPLRSVKLYADCYGEDEAAGTPSKWSYLAGVRLNDLLRTGRTDLRIEYVDTHPVAYTHHLYTSGYTYKGRTLGHHVGPDARDLFVQLSHYLQSDLVVDLAYDRQIHIREGDTERIENILESHLTVFPSREWWITVGYRFETGMIGNDNNHYRLRGTGPTVLN